MPWKEIVNEYSQDNKQEYVFEEETLACSHIMVYQS